MLGNIKKLPLISHKAAANRNDAFIVLAALRDGATSMWLFSLGTGPLRCVTLGAPFVPACQWATTTKSIYT